MLRSRWSTFPICAAILAAASASCVYAAVPCESLTSATLQGGAITAAHVVAAGQYAPPSGGGRAEGKEAYLKMPAFCRVEASLKPSSDSDIRIEVWLPLEDWNGKLLETGNGAFSPALSYSVMAQALKAGYAATGSNTGHEENSSSFALGHPEKIIDFGYRAVHENAVAAKAIAAAFYGSAVRKAYFQGCSTGGRQAYGEPQRYPDDFDGVVAGAPGINFTRQTAAELAIIQQVHKNPASFISAEKLKMLHSAVMAACDELDGVKDGLIENPLHCQFDPGTLLCKEADGPNCLTAPQAALVREIYAGVKDSSGKLVFPGLPPGTEAGWGMMLIRTEPLEYGVGAYRSVVMQDPQWDYLTLDLDRDIPAADKKVGAIMNNNDPNLKAFFARGGKLLGYHGWADGGNSPLNHIAYYKSVAGVMGGEKALSNSYRLFLVPGMGHCGGGDGTSTFDLLKMIDTWVSTGKAPESIPASRVRDGKVDRTRPLCPYPQQAVYKGAGSTDDAANFTCAVK